MTKSLHDQDASKGNKNLIAAVLCAAVSFLILGAYLFSLSAGFEPGKVNIIAGRDFVNLHTAGELLSAGKPEVLFSEDAYMEVLWGKYGPDYTVHNWSYPPTMFWTATFFGLFDYFAALTIWHALGVLLIIGAVRTLKLPIFWALLIVFSPAGVLNIIAGQNGFIIAALTIFALAFATHRPALSGLSWAILTIKPHLGILALPMLFFQRGWSVILSGAIAFSFLVVITIFAWGIDPWVSFLTYTTNQQRVVLETWGGLMYLIVPTGFMQGRVLGLDPLGAYVLHAVVAVIGLFLAARAWPKCKDDLRLTITWFVISTFLILPYSFLYDLVIFQIVLVLWHRDADKLFGLTQKYADYLWIFCWFAPILSWAIVDATLVQVMPPLLAFMLWQIGSHPEASDGSAL